MTVCSGVKLWAEKLVSWGTARPGEADGGRQTREEVQQDRA